MSGRFHPRDSLPVHFKQGSIDLQKHEPHSPKSPSSSLAADELCGRRGVGSSRRLRSFIGFGLVLPSGAAKRLFTFPRCARVRIRDGSRIPLGAEASPLESAQPAVIAYLFIAVVPVLLLLTMAGLGAYLLYWQLGSYVLYTDMQERLERLSQVAATMATSYAIESASGHRAAALALPEDRPSYLMAAMTALPGLKIESGMGDDLLLGPDGSAQKGFSGLVLNGDA